MEMEILSGIKNFLQLIHKISALLLWAWLNASVKSSSVVDFPGGAVVKNPPVKAGDTGLSPAQGRSHMLRSN